MSFPTTADIVKLALNHAPLFIFECLAHAVSLRSDFCFTKRFPRLSSGLQVLVITLSGHLAFAVADRARRVAVVLANAKIAAAVAIHKPVALTPRTRAEFSVFVILVAIVHVRASLIIPPFDARRFGSFAQI